MYDELDEQKNEGAAKKKTSLAAIIRNALAWAYCKLAAMRTSVYLLLIIALFYLIGTIFPQGGKFEDYVKEGGGAQWLVSAFDLLDFFASPLFLAVAALLLLNLIICSYERYASLFAKRSFPKPFKPTHTLSLTLNATDAHEAVKAVMENKLGFKQTTKDSLWAVMEKGISYRWLTWLYHAGLILCFVGATITYLVAYEDSITLWPGKPGQIKAESNGRLQKYLSIKSQPIDWNIILDEFSTEYAQKPKLIYPEDGLSRLAVGLGWLDLKYENVEDMYVPRAWKSKVRILKGGVLPMLDATIAVNAPLRYDAFTFYQDGYEQKVRIRVDDNPITLLTKAGDELMLPGVGQTIKFENIKTGTIYKKNGTQDKINITADMKTLMKNSGKEKKFEDYGTINIGDEISIEGKRLSFVDLVEGTTLSYRYDPGAPLLWYSGIFVLILMAMRFYGRTYFAAYNIEDHNGIVILDLYVEAKGFLANPDKIVESLEHFLSANEVPIDPIPESKSNNDNEI